MEKTLTILIITSLLLGGVLFYLNQGEDPKNLLVALVGKEQSEDRKLEWINFISEDNYFTIDYPKNWTTLNDEGLYFGAGLYNDNGSEEAIVKIKKIEATNKIELQEALNKENETCAKESEECPSAIKIDELVRFKISGETARINTENKYLSGTTIYVYLNDYYLAIYLEYNDEAYLPTFKKIVDSIFIDMESKFVHYYCNRRPNEISYHNKLSAYCYTVEPGDTLWNIAERYYGDPYLWERIKLLDGEGWGYAQIDPEDPNALSPGTRLVVQPSFAFVNDDRIAAGTSDGWGIDTDTGDLFSTAAGKIYINNEIYDQGFAMVYNFLVDERTNNKIYIVSPKREDGETRNRALYQFIFNKQRNSYVGPGANFELITFNHDEDKYTLRTNVRQDVPDPGFIVLSNIGNGPEFDYLDSIIWYDNDTLIYRAQNNDEWRLVINHEDYEVYDYIENLRVENGVIKFNARDKKGKWSEEELVLEKDQYNAELISIPDIPPVGDEFLIYLKNTRSDLSEADIFRIEKNYHYKKGTLVDEFGKIVEDPVDVYLDPVSGVGMSEDIGRLTFTAERGSFELFVNEIGPYTLSLEEGWSSEDLEDINSVDFRYAEKQVDFRNLNKEYKITVSNKEYDQKVRDSYSEMPEPKDTLWSFAERHYGHGYYWPIIAENNNFGTVDENLELDKYDKLFIKPFSEFHRDELYEWRKKYHDENKEEIFTIENEDYNYSINYPECWTLSDPNNSDSNNLIHQQRIIGPKPAQNPQGQRQASVGVLVYDNSSGMDFGEFVVYRRIIYQSGYDQGRLTYDIRDDGGILVSHYGELKHLIFFKDDLIYDISSKSHHSIDDISKKETESIVNSFKFLD